MRTLFHFLIYLALGIWVGALVFFGAILAPLAFSQLPPLFANPAQGLHAAGMVVGPSLIRLHWMGIVCGIVFLVITVLARPHFGRIVPQFVLVVAMLVLTGYSQFSIIPRMNTAEASVGGNVEAVPANNPGRMIFDRLHQRSVDVESLVLLCGLIALGFTAHYAQRRDKFAPVSGLADREATRGTRPGAVKGSPVIPEPADQQSADQRSADQGPVTRV